MSVLLHPGLVGAQTIRLLMWDSDRRVIMRKFAGRYLVGSATEGMQALIDGRDDYGFRWSVIQTHTGAIVLYLRHLTNKIAPAMDVFSSFGAFAADPHVPREVVAAAEATHSALQNERQPRGH